MVAHQPVARLPAALDQRAALPKWYPFLPPLPHCEPAPILAPLYIAPPAMVRPHINREADQCSTCKPLVVAARRAYHFGPTSMQPEFQQAWLAAPVAARTLLQQVSPVRRPLVDLLQAYADGDDPPPQWQPFARADTFWVQVIIGVVAKEGVWALVEWLKGATNHRSFRLFAARLPSHPFSPQIGAL